MFDFITWTAHPVIFQFDTFWGTFALRWYALMFIVGFAIGVKLMERYYRLDGKDPERVYSLFMYCFFGTLIGARLGHCLFYNPDYYLSHPLEIVMTWKGGLASHGGTLGVFCAVLMYAKRDKIPALFVLDRLGIAVAPVAALIRIGNLFNHEIYGHVTSLPWGFRFITNLGAYEAGREPIFTEPSHPTQIYEALCYLAVFGINAFLYKKCDAGRRPGLLLGSFFTLVFGSRFLIEFVKNVQEDFEEGMLLDMGQLLSIPFIVGGIWLIVRAMRRPMVTFEPASTKK
ncbi:MAG: prolipoprotein diacylglyceryl transferase [Bacteroidales bacterium]|jgi:prolipoprotein diacylglyceryl transferase|nr:prolipoprotein diacylglyceryl transferase [Bacteroidales bacterium]